jgi:hypothetical protein
MFLLDNPPPYFGANHYYNGNRFDVSWIKFAGAALLFVSVPPSTRRCLPSFAAKKLLFITNHPKDDPIRIMHNNSRFSYHYGSRRQKQIQLYAGRRDENDDDNDNDTSDRNTSQGWKYAVNEGLLNSSFKLDAVKYIFLMAGLSFLIPTTTTALLIAFYLLYCYLGQKFVLEDYFDEKLLSEQYSGNNEAKNAEDDDEPPPIYFFAFAAALLSSGILTPLDLFSSESTSIATAIPDGSEILLSAPLLLVGVGIILALTNAVSLQEAMFDRKQDSYSMPSQENIEKQLMDLWDKQFLQDDSNNDEELFL